MANEHQLTGSISASIPDWSREFKPWFSWNPSRSLLASVRSYQNIDPSNPFGFAIKGLAVFRHRFWSAIAGADIPINCNIGGGLLIPHPNGIVIHPDAIVGVNCLLFQQVTIGQCKGGVPVIGGHVDIGAGAKILGEVAIGDHAIVGANAVVLCNIPPFATAVGVPATVTAQSK
ncbi:MAG: serine acetyltransferase [Pseudomonadota bacterium]